MGVPKFYRWLSERYPCLSQVVEEHQIPEFDNLYLDMNGIIHNCSHPNDDDPHFRITEEQIFRDIFHYIEVLFRIVRPRKVFFMAVDGVAPRAKMNQQRGRRFKSAQAAESAEKKAKDKGEELPSEDRFDSNCITPGTVFMARLQEQLKYFVNMKITQDEMWQGLDIYLSGHETPGEGEHKIMDFIRCQRSQDSYNPHTRHCLYGLDADLIMLGLVSHEPHFALLREEVKFIKNKSSGKTAQPERITFHLLHLSMLREYMEFEFASLKVADVIPFVYDLEKVIDDWVLLGFLVGNDFIPHLPDLHIAQDALPFLYKLYCQVLPTLDGYMNEGGYLNLGRFEKFMEKLGQFDRDKFSDDYDDFKWLDNKKSGRKDKSELRQLEAFTDFDEGLPEEFSELEEKVGEADCKVNEKADEEVSSSPIVASAADLEMEIRNLKLQSGDVVNLFNDDDEEMEQSWNPVMEMEFVQHKRNYYREKMAYKHITPEELHEQAIQYVVAIQWNLHYYYHGVCSWSWYYPHHYAPFLSDVKGFSSLVFNFELGTPFMPFEQLLAVLPAGSKKLLPEAFQGLMTNNSSPIIDYYPEKFKQDLNGKQHEWEAVVLIPFINEKRLLEAMKPCYSRLSLEEIARNCHSGHLLYTTGEPNGVYPSPAPSVFYDIRNNRAVLQRLDPDYFRIQRDQIKLGRLETVDPDTYYLGFPTFKHIPHRAVLKFADVRVFQQTSKKDSFIVFLQRNDAENRETEIKSVASRLIGQQIYVKWPFLCPAIVEKVSTASESISAEDGNASWDFNKIGRKEAELWARDASIIKQDYRYKRAIEIGEVHMLVYAKPTMGRKFICVGNKISLEHQWAQAAVPFALQTIVEKLNVVESSLGEIMEAAQMFPLSAEVFSLNPQYYGWRGKVIGSADVPDTILVELENLPEPDLTAVTSKIHKIALSYAPGWQLARDMGISSHFISRITGTVLMTDEDDPDAKSNEKLNIGLNLKFNKKNEEVPDYTKKDADGKTWLYSSKVVEIIDDYYQKFPEVLNYIHDVSSSEDVYKSSDVFNDPSTRPAKFKELSTWLKALPSARVTHQAVGTNIVDEKTVAALEKTIQKWKTLTLPTTMPKTFKLSELYRSALNHGSTCPDAKTDYHLFDRVVNVRDGYSVPVGLRGTVIGVHPGQQEGDLQLEVLFDESFVGGQKIRSSNNNGYRLPAAALINLTFGHQAWKETTKSFKGKTNMEVPVKSSRTAEREKMSGPPRYNPPPRFDHNQQQQHVNARPAFPMVNFVRSSDDYHQIPMQFQPRQSYPKSTFDSQPMSAPDRPVYAPLKGYISYTSAPITNAPDNEFLSFLTTVQSQNFSGDGMGTGCVGTKKNVGVMQTTRKPLPGGVEGLFQGSQSRQKKTDGRLVNPAKKGEKSILNELFPPNPQMPKFNTAKATPTYVFGMGHAPLESTQTEAGKAIRSMLSINPSGNDKQAVSAEPNVIGRQISTSVVQLREWCKENDVKMPSFSSHRQDNVGGVSIRSAPMPSGEAAQESAATELLHRLMSQMSPKSLSRRQQPPPPQPIFSQYFTPYTPPLISTMGPAPPLAPPNILGVPVSVVRLQHPPLGHPPNHNVARLFHQASLHHRQQTGHQQPPVVKPHSDQSFVPMQVTKKKKESIPLAPSYSQGDRPQKEESKRLVEPLSSPQQQDCSAGVVSDSGASKDLNGSGGKNRNNKGAASRSSGKKGKSRLAINFQPQ